MSNTGEFGWRSATSNRPPRVAKSPRCTCDMAPSWNEFGMSAFEPPLTKTGTEIWMYGDSREADEIISSAEDARAALEEHNWELAKQKLHDVQSRIQGLLQTMTEGPNTLHEPPVSERRGMLGF